MGRTPSPVTDPVIREDIIAAHLLRVYESRLEMEAQLDGLMEPPAPSLPAQVLLQRVRLRLGRSRRRSEAA